MQGFSIIICCYSSAARLPETLRHIALLEGLPAETSEILIIDNASTDNTAAVAEHLAQQLKLSNLTVLYEPQPGLSNARKKGLTAAQFDTIIFCDDDNWLAADYILQAERCLKAYPKAGVVGGLGTPYFEGNVKPDWFDAYQGTYAVGPQVEEEGVVPAIRSYVFGAGSVWRKETLEAITIAPMLVTGRKEGKLTSSDDNEMCYKAILAGYQVVYTPALRFTHYIPASRLTLDYVQRIKEDSAPGSLYLHGLMYKIGVDPQAFNTYSKRTWWGQCLAAAKHHLQGKTHSAAMTIGIIKQLILMNSRYNRLFK